MKHSFRVTLFSFGIFVALAWALSLFANADSSASSTGDNDTRGIFSHLLPIIYSSGKPVRIYYLGDCASTESPVPLPRVKVKAPAKGKLGLAAIREIFENDDNVNVAEDEDGIIRISIGKVPTEILQTKLPPLNLDEDAQYNPHKVFDAILRTREFVAAEKSLGFTDPVRLGGTLEGADPRYPHLPPKLHNMTVEQILDLVAKTWAGRIVVVYGVCDKPRKSDNGRMFVLTWKGEMVQPSDVGFEQ